VAVAHRVYARALVESALQEGRLTQVHEDLRDFAAAVDDVPELAALLENPEIDRAAKASVLEELLTGGDELVRNFLLLLVEKGRIAELHEIAREVDTLIAALARHLPDLHPRGAAAGLHLLLDLPDDVEEEALVRAAQSRGVGLDGLAPHCARPGRPGVILGYGRIAEPAIAGGIRALSGAIEAVTPS